MHSLAQAEDVHHRFAISGFGTFSGIGTDTNAIGFVRDRTQSEDVTDSWGISADSRLGLQLDAEITPDIHSIVQFVARDHGGDFLEQNLEWAFVRWNPRDDLSLRAGRLGADLFLLSDNRNIGFTYPWMRPPHEFYANLPIYHLDGVDATKRFTFGEDMLSIKVVGAYNFNQLPTHNFGTINLDSTAFAGSIVYESGNWRSRIGYGYLHLLSDVPNQRLIDILNMPAVSALLPGVKTLIPNISLKDSNIHFFSLGTSYDDGVWLAHAEASYTDTQTPLFPDTASAYLSIGRRFDKLTFYTMYGVSETFESKIAIPKPVVAIPQLQSLQGTLDNAINLNGIHEQSLSLGARWDILPKVALKTEWSHYWLGSNGTKLWMDPNSNAVPSEVNVWSVGLDFIF